MHFDDTHRDAAASPVGGPRSGRTPISRRQAIGRMSALATAGVAAWVVPEILTAKPAAGAAMSSPGSGGTTGSGGAPGGTTESGGTPGSGVTSPAANPPSSPTIEATTAASTVQPSGPTSGVTTAAATQSSGSLAYSGLNIERDAEIGAALIAGGWAMHHWASRNQEEPERPPA